MIQLRTLVLQCFLSLISTLLLQIEECKFQTFILNQGIKRITLILFHVTYSIERCQFINVLDQCWSSWLTLNKVSNCMSITQQVVANNTCLHVVSKLLGLEQVCSCSSTNFCPDCIFPWLDLTSSLCLITNQLNNVSEWHIQSCNVSLTHCTIQFCPSVITQFSLECLGQFHWHILTELLTNRSYSRTNLFDHVIDVCIRCNTSKHVIGKVTQRLQTILLVHCRQQTFSHECWSLIRHTSREYFHNTASSGYCFDLRWLHLVTKLHTSSCCGS